MNNDDMLDVEEYFASRAALVKIETAFEQHTTATHLSSASIIMNAEFYARHKFLQFARDVRRIREIEKEEYLRSKHPSLAAAYEEYQILLKLLK